MSESTRAELVARVRELEYALRNIDSLLDSPSRFDKDIYDVIASTGIFEGKDCE